ncbi:MAG: helix-turn-helix domain-containing protein [Thermoguttaceae bacterium]
MKTSLFSFLKSLATPVAFVSRAREIVYANDAMLTWCGVTSQQIVGRRLAPATANAAPSADDTPVLAALEPPPEALRGEWIRCHRATPTNTDDVCTVTFIPLHSRRKSRSDEGNAVLVIVEDGSLPVTLFSYEREETSELREILAEVRSVQQREATTFTILGMSPALEALRRQQQLAARATVPVVIVGEHGTPFLRLAESIHWGRQESEIGMLLTLDAAVIEGEYLIEMVETFRRRYTPNSARIHTLVLRDGDAISSSAATTLLEHIAHFPPHLRLIVTSKQPPSAWPDPWGLGVATMLLAIPPLKERRDDISLLAQNTIEEWNASTHEHQIAGVASDALDILVAATWNGNDAELARAIEEACQRATSTLIAVADLPEYLRLEGVATSAATTTSNQTQIAWPDGLTLDAYLHKIELETITRAVEDAHGNKTQAARTLGISRTRLIQRLKET